MSDSKRQFRVMRRHRPILFAMVFLACIGLADRLAGFGLGLLVRASDYRLSRIYAGDGATDVLVSGNSVGNAMIIPTNLTKTLGRPVFSIASHGMDAITQHALLLDYLDHQPVPKLVVMEMRPVLAAWKTAPAFSTFQSLSPRIRTIVATADPSIGLWSSVFHTFRVNSPLLPNILVKIVDRDDQQTGPSNGKINAHLIHQWKIRPTSPKVSIEQLQAFATSVKHLRQAGSRVIVVMAPLHPAARRDGKWIEQSENQVRSMLPPDVPLVDLSHALSNDMYFEDPIHLNRIGREALEPTLLTTIRQALARAPDKTQWLAYQHLRLDGPDPS